LTFYRCQRAQMYHLLACCNTCSLRINVLYRSCLSLQHTLTKHRPAYNRPDYRPRCGLGGLCPSPPSDVVSDVPGTLGLLSPAVPALPTDGDGPRRRHSPVGGAGLLARRPRRFCNDDSDDDDDDLGNLCISSRPTTPALDGVELTTGGHCVITETAP